MNLSRQQLTLVGIFALFFAPVLLVMLMRTSWWQYQPAGLKNQGFLVQPPVHLALDQTQGLDGKWLLLNVLDHPCAQACIDSVTNLRQIHRAAGRKSKYMAVVLLSTGQIDPALRTRLESIYPEFNFVADSAGRNIAILAKINTLTNTANGGSNEFQSYILDPMLNVILAYGVGSHPNDMHKDIKRLLKWSDQENTR